MNPLDCFDASANVMVMLCPVSSLPDEDSERSAGVVSQRRSGPPRCGQDLPLRQTGVLDR